MWGPFLEMLLTSLGVLGCGEQAMTLRIKVAFVGGSDRKWDMYQKSIKLFIADSSPSVIICNV